MTETNGTYSHRERGDSVLSDPAFFGQGAPPPEHAQRNFEFVVTNVMSMQREMFNRLLDPRRDMDKECGFPKVMAPEQYWQLYNEDAIAARIVEVVPKAVWAVQPTVYEDEDAETQTPFEAAWDDLCAGLRPEKSYYQDEAGSPMWNLLARADVLSGIGQYGVILLGFDDGLDLSEPVNGVEETNSMPKKVTKRPRPKPGPDGENDGPTATSAPPAGPNARDQMEKRAAKKEKPVGNRRYVLNWSGGDAKPRGKFDLTRNAYRGPPPNTYTGVGADEYAIRQNPGDKGKAAPDPNSEEDDLFGDTGSIDVGAGDDGETQLDAEGNPVEPEFVPRNRLLYMRAFPEAMASVSTYETNRSSERYGKPVMYLIGMNDPKDGASAWGSSRPPSDTRLVHWTRVIHVVLDGQGSSEVFGQERLRQVYRNVISLQKLYYGSAEMYWKGAFPGLSFESHPQLGGQVDFSTDKLRQSVEKMSNGLQRYMVTAGGTAKMLAPAVVDPTPQINVHIDAICIRIGVPIPVFKGYEIGEQASQNNDEDWDDKVRAAQREIRTPKLVVPLVDRLINVGCLPEPAGYSVHWPDLSSESDVERSQIALTFTQAMVAYISGNCAVFMPPLEYLVTVWKMDEEEATAIVEAAEKVLEQQKLEQEQAMQDSMAMQEDAIDRGIAPDPNDPDLVPDVASSPAGANTPFGSPKPEFGQTENVENAFCATGAGGGIDPHCGETSGGSSSKSLQEWMAGSKVVAADGSPLIVHHGGSEEVKEFSAEKSKGIGIWFAEKSGAAKKYAGPSGKITSVYLSVKNPVPRDKYVESFQKFKHLPEGKVREDAVIKDLKEQGYDGMKSRVPGSETWMVFDGSQIRHQ